MLQIPELTAVNTSNLLFLTEEQTERLRSFFLTAMASRGSMIGMC